MVLLVRFDFDIVTRWSGESVACTSASIKIDIIDDRLHVSRIQKGDHFA